MEMFLFLIIPSLLFEHCNAFRMRGGEGSFDVYVPVNGNISLHCDYNLEGDTLYTLFWYKNEKLLLKYHPKAPIIRAQGTRGLSSANQIRLNNSPPPIEEDFTPTSPHRIPPQEVKNNSIPANHLPAPVKGYNGAINHGGLEALSQHHNIDPNVMRIYPNSGADLSLGGSKNSSRRISGAEIVLSSVKAEAAGNYTCEATTDGPVFQTVRKSFNLLVVGVSNSDEKKLVPYNQKSKVPPTSTPLMTGVSGRVKADQEVTATCDTPPAYPAPTVKFYINGQPVIKEFMSRPTYRNRSNRILVTRSVTFRVYRRLFINGHLQLECRVSLMNDEWSATQELILEDHLLEHAAGCSTSLYLTIHELSLFATASIILSIGVTSILR